MSTQQELRKLVEDVYQQGYICGITDGRWFDAYAQMALEIVNDEKGYSDSRVVELYRGMK